MTCRICGAITRELLDVKFNNTYDVCERCEFIGIRLSDTISFDDERIEYDRHENTIENEGYVAMFKRFLEASVIPFKKNGTGFDFGSGPEPVLTQVIARDYEFDMDHYDLHYQPIKVHSGKVYDVIVSTEVAEHLQQPMAVFRELVEHMKLGSIVAIMTLFHEGDDGKFLDWWYRRDVTHIAFYTPKTFAYIAKELGLKVIYTDDKRYITLEKSKVKT